MHTRTLLLLLFLLVFLVVGSSASGLNWFNLTTNELNKLLHIKVSVEESRKKKGKFINNFLLALFIIKGVLIPFAMKIMAVMSSVSVVLSFMSLIISSLIGYSREAWRHAGPTIKFIQAKDSWSRDETFLSDYDKINYLEDDKVSYLGDERYPGLENYYY